METKSTGAVPMPSYDDFEPFCTWRREEEFKRDELKVQISNHGFLKISGERPTGAMKRSRFYREFKIPTDCNSNEIHAKFMGGILYISMPKYATSVTKEAQPAKVNQDSKPKTSQDQVTNKPAITEAIKKIESSKNVTNNEFQPQFSALRLKRFAQMAMGLSMVVAMGSVLNAYFVYKYCVPSS
ncbi:inactive protein RESTRICTED TEV MOVEMENT 2-like isoform X2 [Cornus florida]|uniref:inactive protein RESTRICTED TEV MOVEMENT 2-like isoform X2 n=1 Tax=Cornus florida TaxID=4283 RepID=UPI00289C0CB8|nr:inactive protein RESTRICTED TEV MOVEMENT 2-like isoform X2 [Cornus florida]